MKRFSVYLPVLLATILVVAACGAPVTPTPAAPTGAPTQAPAPKPKAATTTAPAPVRTTPAPQPTRPAETPYYQGKTIEIIIETAAGGGTDTIARITAPYLTKYIPGNPRVILRNQPGGGGMIATASFQEKVKPDGLTLLQHGSGVLSLQLASREMIKYDLTRNRYVGNIARAESIVLIKKGLKSRLTDASARPLVMGTKEGNETFQAVLLYGREFLGWNVRWISGFAGTSEMELAFRRGELDIFATANAFIIQRMTLQEGIAESLAASGNLKEGKFVRRPDFPDVPTFEELLGPGKPSGIPWQAFMVWMGPSGLDKSLAAPPNTPDSVMAILTDAFAKMARDPQFDQTVKKMVTEVYEVGVGKETDGMIKEILGAPPEALNYTKELMIKFGIISR